MRTNHDNTSTQSFRGKRTDSKLGGDLSDGFALVLCFAEERNQRVGGVRDDSADNTSNVTGREGDTELSGFAVCILGLSENVGVEQLDDLLKEEELGHGVRDL